jgi:hypothetical protein
MSTDGKPSSDLDPFYTKIAKQREAPLEFHHQTLEHLNL